jgi:hypothetical protein
MYTSGLLITKLFRFLYERNDLVGGDAYCDCTPLIILNLFMNRHKDDGVCSHNDFQKVGDKFMSPEITLMLCKNNHLL